MEKQIAQASYWLGFVSSVLAVVWKGLEALHVAPESIANLKYMTLYKGGLLFLVLAIASSICAWAKSQKA